MEDGGAAQQQSESMEVEKEAQESEKEIQLLGNTLDEVVLDDTIDEHEKLEQFLSGLHSPPDDPGGGVKPSPSVNLEAPATGHPDHSIQRDDIKKLLNSDQDRGLPRDTLALPIVLDRSLEAIFGAGATQLTIEFEGASSSAPHNGSSKEIALHLRLHRI